MIVDHIDFMLLNRTQSWMYIIGRATFPLFCYAVAVNVLRTAKTGTAADARRKSFITYGLRLMAVALLVEPICRAVRDVDVLNVLFTLALGGVIAAFSLALSDALLFLLFAAASALFFFPGFSEFGWIGIILPACLAAVLRGKIWVWPVLIAFLFALNLGDVVTAPGFAWTAAGSHVLTPAIFAFLGASVLPYSFIVQMTAAPQTGRLLSRYALHIFYPAHLVAIWAAGYFLKGMGWF